jgi:hypothetical protein
MFREGGASFLCWICFQTDARTVLKIVGEFWSPVGDGTRLIAVAPLGILSLESKDGLAHRCQLDSKNASFKSKPENQVASAGTRANKMNRFVTIGCKVTVA